MSVKNASAKFSKRRAVTFYAPPAQCNGTNSQPCCCFTCVKKNWGAIEEAHCTQLSATRIF